jgi:hypothetical protein
VELILGEGRRAPAFASAVFLIGLSALALSVFSGARLLTIALAAIAAAAFSLTHRWLLRWQTLLGALILVILFVPIRKYALPAALPFNLELYRLLVAMIVAFWGTSLLIDRRVRLHRSGLEGPLFVIVLSALVSDILNNKRIAADQVGTLVIKSLTFFVSFFLVFYLIVSVARRFDQIIGLLKLLVAGGFVVAVFAVIESRTQYNIFDHLHSIFPFLNLYAPTGAISRYGHFRAYGSAEHPIALSAVLAMLAPPAVYLARSTRQHRWWIAFAGLILGDLATHSRTGVVMLGVEVLIFAILFPHKVKRLWPLLLPGVLAIHFAAPGTIGALKESFFPKGGIIQDQRGYKNTGRVGKIAPTFREISSEPLFGKGYGTRVIYPRLINNAYVPPNDKILDDQWLATLLEVGVVGTFGWLWLFVRTIRRLHRAAREEAPPRQWLMAALLASITAYVVGMLTYDAFGFIQVTFVLYILLAFACVLLSPSSRTAFARMPATVPARS